MIKAPAPPRQRHDRFCFKWLWLTVLMHLSPAYGKNIISIGEFIEDLQARHRITVTGLTRRYTEPLSFSLRADTPDAVLKQLFRSIGETSYALIHYPDGALIAHVFPHNANIAPALPFEQNAPDISPDIPPNIPMILAVHIESAPPGSAAYQFGLHEGDLIVSYDGHPITQGPLQLVKLMRQTSPEHPVEIILYTANRLVPVRVPGGELDAGIKTMPVRASTIHFK